MKLWATRWRRRARTDSRRVCWHPLVVAIAIAGAVLISVTGGCVSASDHRAVLAERDRLARAQSGLELRVDSLEKSNNSLNAESVQLFESLEDMRGEREQLGADVAELRRARESLSEKLATREMELVARDEQVFQLRGTYDGLVNDLEAEVSAGRIEIERLRVGLQVNVSDEILFPSGTATLNRQGRDVLARVAKQLVATNHAIEVRGHTDNLGIRGKLAERYPSNWELAGARAASVVRLFQENGIAGERLSAVSKGEFDPLASNDTAEDRWRNRRIEIRLVPRAPEPETPSANSADSAASRPSEGS